MHTGVHEHIIWGMLDSGMEGYKWQGKSGRNLKLECIRVITVKSAYNITIQRGNGIVFALDEVRSNVVADLRITGISISAEIRKNKRMRTTKAPYFNSLLACSLAFFIRSAFALAYKSHRYVVGSFKKQCNLRFTSILSKPPLFLNQKKASFAKETYLQMDAFHLCILLSDFTAHIDGHVAQVSDHSSHLLHVLIHLVLPSIICYPTKCI